jgi:hypothetical protein
MKLRLLLLSLAVFLCLNVTFAQTPPLNSEFQSWNEIQLILPVLKGKDSRKKSFDKITFTFTGNLRIGRRNFDLLDNRIATSIDFRVNKLVSLMTGVLYRKDELTINRQRFETRLSGGVVFSKSWKGFTFRNRNMFEHRFRNSRNDTNLYRNRIQLSYPLKFKNKELFTPFISEEGYLDLLSHNWVQNEFYAGLSRKINPRTSIDLAYLRNDSQPVNVNGFSFSLKIRLR